ncbi:reverse transcriptase [Gossypium australe]|uniref:Reverse transcriptase n=1 Tax=Gossypium australe TaxID=47621 RepID=A0A5B6WKC3_9ROSI|nr:reverse transcriptase [Gossypium australe]
MEPYEALYGRKCHTPLCWMKLKEKKIMGPELVKIKDGLKLTKFLCRPKENRYRIQCSRISLFKSLVLEKSTKVRQKREVESSFYWSLLSIKVNRPKIELRPNLSIKEEPIRIIDREVKTLRNKQIPLVKVLQQNHETQEATWEPEELIHQQYPHLFE